MVDFGASQLIPGVRPRKATRASPDYPPAALERGVEGTVVLELHIDSSGRVARAKVVKGIEELNRAALKCTMAWRFEPALKAGKPVAAIAQAPITFKRPKKTDSRT